MKILVNSLAILIAAAIGLGVGFLLRGKPKHQQVASVNSEPQTISKRLSALQRQAVPRIDDSPLTTKLARDLSMSSGVTRWLYWLEALDKAQPADFPRLVRLAQTNDTALRFVTARWVEVAPRHMFDTLIRNHKDSRGFLDDQLFGTLANSLFTEWPRRDPDAAIAALNESGEVGMAKHWRFEVAYAMVEKDIERSLKLMSEWSTDIGFGTSGLRAVAKWAEADPRHAAEFLMAHPQTGHVGRGIIEEIGKVWGKTDPAAALDFIGNRSDTLARTLGEAALKQWSERDLNEAANWLASADSFTRNRMSAAFVEVWGKQDPTSALSWCEENLSGLSLNSAVAGVVKGTAAKDLMSAAALVASMEPSSARAEAAAGIARKMFPDSLSGKTATPEAIAWLTQLDPASSRRVTDEVCWSWAGSDAKSMAAFLSTADPDAISPFVYNIAARELARKGPSAALEWASQLPTEKALVAGGEAFAEWRSFQPETAMKWLHALPKNDARREPFFKQAIQNLAYHPQAAEQLASMAATERAAALPILEAMKLPTDRRARLLEAANAK
jgi:hypothetical protein